MSIYEIPADERDHLYLNCGETLAKCAHFHQSMELVIVLQGEAEAYINGVRYELKAGDSVCCSSFDIHYYKTVPHACYVALVVSHSYLREFYEHVANGTVKHYFSLPKEVLAYAKKWASEPLTQNRLLLFAKLYYLLSFLPICAAEEAPKPKAFIAEVFTYIHQHFKERLTIAEVAKRFGYSRGYLSTLFSAYTGESFNAYLNRLRVLHVKKFLGAEKNSNVLDLALDAGFESASTFYRAYKKQFGEVPYRRNMTK